MPEIVQRIIPAGRRNRPGTKRTPKWIVVHDTANPGADALDHASYLANANTEASWHYTVDDQRVVQHLPLDESAYHAGDGARGPGNLYGIGIEICEFKGDDAQPRRAKAEENAAWLVAKLLRQYGWGIDRVKQHYDFSPWKKNCPRVLRPRWGAWIARVQHYLGQKGEAKTVARPVLRKGDRGQAVKELQEALKRLGHDPGPIDGIFGPKTEAAVKSFQRAAKIAVDGVVGPVTWSKLEAALKAKQQPKFFNPDPDPKPAAPPGPFKDVPGDHWAVKSIERVRDAGIMVGDAGGKFHPDVLATRAELAVVVDRLLQRIDALAAEVDRLQQRQG